MARSCLADDAVRHRSLGRLWGVGGLSENSTSGVKIRVMTISIKQFIAALTVVAVLAILLTASKG
jgi:hypothetical protein